MSRYSDAVIRDGPLAYWRLCDVSGDAQDTSGYGHDAQQTGGVTYGVVGLLGDDLNTAMTFAGTGYFQTAYSSAFDLSNLSVEAMVRVTGAGANAGLFCKTIGGAVNSQY